MDQQCFLSCVFISIHQLDTHGSAMLFELRFYIDISVRLPMTSKQKCACVKGMKKRFVFEV